jgi:hypothetical protein
MAFWKQMIGLALWLSWLKHLSTRKQVVGQEKNKNKTQQEFRLTVGGDSIGDILTRTPKITRTSLKKPIHNNQAPGNFIWE